MNFKIHTDGGARGNPGPAALGIVIFKPQGGIVKKIGKYLGKKTNNEAEYEAVIQALKEALDLGAEAVEVNLDSELVVRQLGGVYRIKNARMRELVSRVRNLESNFSKVSYKHIPREKNALADQLVNEVLDRQ